MKGEKISLDVPAGFYGLRAGLLGQGVELHLGQINLALSGGSGFTATVEGAEKYYEVKNDALAALTGDAQWVAAPVAAGVQLALGISTWSTS